MNKKLKALCVILACITVFCLILAACDPSGNSGNKGDDNQGGAPAKLPEFNEDKKDLTESDVKDTIKDITGEEDVDVDFSKFEGFEAANVDRDKYLAYVDSCVNQGYEKKGEYTENGVTVTALEAGDNKYIIVTLDASGKMTAVMYQIERPTEPVCEWPGQSVLEKFGVKSLKQPIGSKLTYVKEEKASGLSRRDSLSIRLSDVTANTFYDLKNALIAAGYNDEEKLNLEGQDGRMLYCAYAVINETEFRCNLDFMGGDRFEISIDLENITQGYILDGKSFYEVSEVGTYVIKETYLRTADEKDKKPEEMGKQGAETVEETSVIGTSYNKDAAMEYFVDSNGTIRDGFLYKNSNRTEYRLADEGHKLQFDRKSDMRSIRGYLRNRLPIMQYYFENSSHEKTGKTMTIANFTCAEYSGTVVVKSGDKEYKWSAVFYVNEENGLCFGYEGKRNLDRDETTKIYLTEFKKSAEIVENALKLPIISDGGGSEKGEFPREEIDVATTVKGLIPEINAAEGWDSSHGNFQRPDGESVPRVTFNGYGVERKDFEAFEESVASAGFKFLNDRAVWVYNLDEDVVLCMDLVYDEGERKITFAFYKDNSNIVPKLPQNTAFDLTFVNDESQTERAHIEFRDEYIIAWSKHEAAPTKTILYMDKQKDGSYNYYGAYSNLSDMIVNSKNDPMEKMTDLTVTARLAGFSHSAYLLFEKNVTGNEFLRKDNYSGYPVSVYDVHGEEHWYSADLGLVLRVVKDGRDKLTVEMSEPLKSDTPFVDNAIAYNGGGNKIVLNGSQYLLLTKLEEVEVAPDEQTENMEKFFADNYSRVRATLVLGAKNSDYLNYNQKFNKYSYPIKEDVINYPEDKESGNKSSTFDYARLYLTDGDRYVLEVEYNNDFMWIKEYELKDGAEDFFGDEIMGFFEYNQYTMLGDGKIEYFDGISGKDGARTLIVGCNGTVGYDGNRAVVVTDTERQAYDCTIFDGRAYLRKKYTDVNDIDINLYANFFSDWAMIKRDLTRYTEVGNDLMFNDERAVTVYEGIITERGKKNKLFIWVDDQTGLYLRVRKTADMTATFDGPQMDVDYAFQIYMITPGSFIDGDFENSPYADTRYDADKWSEELMLCEKQPVPLNFESFEFLAYYDSVTVKYYGQNTELSEVDLNYWEEVPYSRVEEEDYFEASYSADDGSFIYELCISQDKLSGEVTMTYKIIPRRS